jgi:hypothetical protein
MHFGLIVVRAAMRGNCRAVFDVAYRGVSDKRGRTVPPEKQWMGWLACSINPMMCFV